MAQGLMGTGTAVDDRDIPLCVDLDGSLIRSDVLLETYLRCVKQNILYAFAAILWLLRGKAFLKAELARRTTLDVSLLPVNAEVLEWLRSEHSRGRRLILCTAADRSLAAKIAAHFGIFERTLASDGSLNLSGRNKLQALETEYGRGRFDYVGNETQDLHIWESARKAIVVAPGFWLRRRVSRLQAPVKIFPRKDGSVFRWLRAMRLHQWVKNLLIFVPAVVAHRITEPAIAGHAVLAFLWFSVCASATYMINDLLDLDADRLHHRKRSRPFASGDLSLAGGIAAAAILLIVGVAGAALTLGWQFLALLFLYLISTVWYSAVLKRVAMVDVLMLAALYTIRVIAGGVAVHVNPSFWLLAFSMFMFLSLALVKRYTELRTALAAGNLQVAGRGYNTDDISLLLSFGTSSSLISILVLALYVNSGAAALYRHPEALWMLCPAMLYWVCRVWRKSHRGELHDDPVVFATTDKPSLMVAAICVVLALIAI